MEKRDELVCGKLYIEEEWISNCELLLLLVVMVMVMK